MLLTIKSDVPEWWTNAHETNSIKSWWNGMEWQDYSVPKGECNGLDVIQETLCVMDNGVYEVMGNVFPLEWLYKMIGYAGNEAHVGIVNEVENIKEVVSMWMF